jgi:hypothetical protein
MSRQRALAIDYGEPKLVTLFEGEEAYLAVLAARMKDELDGQRVEEMVVASSTVRGIPPLVPETIDGGANYTDGQDVRPVSGGPVVSSISGEAKGQQAPGPDNSNQGTLFHSDQAVAETVVTSAEKGMGIEELRAAVLGDAEV